MRDMGCVARLLGCGARRPWFAQVEGARDLPLMFLSSSGTRPSCSALLITFSGKGDRHSKSPIR